MGLGFLVDQIYLVSSENYDPHAKKSEVFWFFIYRALLDCTAGNFLNLPMVSGFT